MFEAEYMEPDDPLQHWRKKVPKGVNLSYTKWKRTFTMKCTQFVRLSKKVEAGKETRNTIARARQLVAFCTRIKPIHILLWNILQNRIPHPLPKGPPQGVSTFCHLEGVPDKDAIDFLTLVWTCDFINCCRFITVTSLPKIWKRELSKQWQKNDADKQQ